MRIQWEEFLLLLILSSPTDLRGVSRQAWVKFGTDSGAGSGELTVNRLSRIHDKSSPLPCKWWAKSLSYQQLQADWPLPPASDPPGKKIHMGRVSMRPLAPDSDSKKCFRKFRNNIILITHKELWDENEQKARIPTNVWSFQPARGGECHSPGADSQCQHERLLQTTSAKECHTFQSMASLTWLYAQSGTPNMHTKTLTRWLSWL